MSRLIICRWTGNTTIVDTHHDWCALQVWKCVFARRRLVRRFHLQCTQHRACHTWFRLKKKNVVWSVSSGERQWGTALATLLPSHRLNKINDVTTTAGPEQSKKKNSGFLIYVQSQTTGLTCLRFGSISQRNNCRFADICFFFFQLFYEIMEICILVPHSMLLATFEAAKNVILSQVEKKNFLQRKWSINKIK